MPTGEYCLTARGKEFANNLDDHFATVQKQPKLSVMIVAQKQDETGQVLYLCQQRHRNPYWGFWGFISGPIRWGVTPEDAAAYELNKQAGLQADCKVRLLYRKRDYSAANQELLEDKMFVVVEACNLVGDLPHTWKGGQNQWLTADALRLLPHKFTDSDDIITALASGDAYLSNDEIYTETEY